MNMGFVYITAGVLIIGGTVYRLARPQIRRRRLLRERILVEDALKFIFTARSGNQVVNIETLAGGLEISREKALHLVDRMRAAEMIHARGERLELTREGEQLAIPVIRAHRLLERYLSDEAGVPLSRIHHLAEHAEHHLTEEGLAVLEEHLGHPQRDPHGDPIPTSKGNYSTRHRVALSDWPLQLPARVVHIEDEPPVAMKRILKTGIGLGKVVQLVGRDDRGIEVQIGQGRHRLSPSLASLIEVRTPEATSSRREDLRLLSELKRGDEARVVSLADDCRGMNRRRLLDFGLTPGAVVRVELANAFQSARAYRVRGTLVALREEQADKVYVKLTRSMHKSSGKDAKSQGQEFDRNSPSHPKINTVLFHGL